MAAPTRLRLAHVIFLLSGGCGLGYQMVWTRWFGLGLGQEMPALLAVVAAFFGGCALGAGAMDGVIRRSRQPVHWYAGLEVLLGLWAFASVHLIPAAYEFALEGMGLDSSRWRQAAIAFGVPFFLLLPATAALGAALPAMERFARSLSADGRVVGSLYAANTFGAVLGTLGGAFILVPWLGLTRTLQGFAVLNLAGAAAILAVATRCEPPSEKPRPVLAPLSARALGAVLFATGLLGIGLEVLGVRMLRLVLDDTVFTFACVLAVYLLGTATGAALAKRCLARVPLDRRLARLLAGTGVTCALSGWALVAAPDTYTGLRAGLGASPGARALADVLVSALVF